MADGTPRHHSCTKGILRANSFIEITIAKCVSGDASRPFLLLLVTAGLSLRTLQNVLSLHSGLAVNSVLVATLDLGPRNYDPPEVHWCSKRCGSASFTCPR